jgi:putative hydrolase of the HAD superfamily
LTSSPKKFRGVVFDLFGTLVDEDAAGVRESLLDIARLLRMPEALLMHAWRESREQRNTGELGRDPREMFEHLCALVGVSPKPDTLDEAVNRYVNKRRSGLAPREGVIETLENLKKQKITTAVVSNCSNELPDVWPLSELGPHFNVAIFSAAVGVMKPDPAIFKMALDQLKLKANQCLYIGDGGDGELIAARETGMETVMIKVPYHDPGLYGQHEGAQTWDGPRIESIEELPGLLG